MNCPCCDKEYANKRGFSNHVRRCPKNPDRIHEVLTDAGREKIRRTTIEQNQQKWSDPDFRKKHSESMKRAVLEHPESYTSSNRGRTKQVTYNGVKFQGQWELDFYKWCESNNIECLRNEQGFPYIWNGKRMYFPDFFLPKYNAYVEVKGYKTERDEAKWSQFPKHLLKIVKEDIIRIRRNEFALAATLA